MPSFTCPTCGSPRDPDSELCPRCLFQQAVDLSDSTQDVAEEETLDASERRDAPAPRQVGDYEILEELGRGGMGIVYLARQRSLDRVVAVKLLLGGLWAPREARERFLREARAAAALRHPGIVAIHEVGEQEGLLYLSMDYVAGTDLDRHLRAGFYVSPEQAARWCAEAARAIGFAHERGILHRDLKPSNVLIASDGHLVVTDFGLARPIGKPGPTVTGQVLGSPGFLPPERLNNPSAEGPQGDVYSLGAILYTLLTGRPPVTGGDAVEVLLKAREAEIVPPRSLDGTIPRDLESVCLRCLARDPANRYLDAGELAEELDRFLAGEDVVARPLRAPQRLGRWLWRRRKRVLAVAAVTAVALAGYLTLQERQQRENLERQRVERAALDATAAMERRAVALHWMGFGLSRFLEASTPYRPVWMEASADGRRLAVLAGGFGQSDWSLHLFDTDSGAELRAVSGYVAHLERRLPLLHTAVALQDSSFAYVFHPASGHIVEVPIDPRQASRAPQTFWCFDPEGRFIAYDNKNLQSLYVWDLERRAPAAAIDRSVLIPLTFLAPGKLAVLHDHRPFVVEIETGDMEPAVPEIGSDLLTLSPDGRTAVFLPREPNGRMFFWDLQEKKEIGRLSYGDVSGQVLRSWSPDGRSLAFGLPGEPPQVWDVRGRPVSPVWLSFSGQKFPLVFLARFSPENRYVSIPIAAKGFQGVSIFDPSTGELLETLKDQNLATWDPRGGLLATAGKLTLDESVHVGASGSHVGLVLWRVHTSTPYYPAPPGWGPFTEPLSAELSWSDGDRFLHSRMDLFEEEVVWEVVSKKPPRLRLAAAPDAPPQPPLGQLPPQYPPQVEMPVGDRFFVGGPRGTIELRAPGDPPKLLRRLEAHQGLILALAVDPAGRWLVSGGVGDDLVFWRLTDLEEWLRLPAHSGGTTALAFHPSGDFLVSRGPDGSLKVWDLEELLEVLGSNGL